jgi:uncharacterized damage-inducible protein DinB
MQAMNKSEIATLLHFNFWANARILSTCERMSTDEFTRLHTPDPGWGSLRGILVHTLDTEYGWRSVLQALDEDKILEAGDFADVAALQTRWNIERAAWFDFVDRLSDESINLGYGDNPHTGPKVWQTILHVVTHGIQHRSEAAAILTGYGQSPGELDFDLFLKEMPEFL